MSTKFEYYDDSSGVGTVSTTVWRGQTFTPEENFVITSAKLELYIGSGSPIDGNVLGYLTATDVDGLPTGSALASASITGASVTATAAGTLYEFTLSVAVPLVKNIKYAFYIKRTGTTNNLFIVNGQAGAGYADGATVMYSGSWSIEGSGAYDLNFETWGYSIDASSIVDKTYSRKLIAITANYLYYESTLGTTLTALAASYNDILVVDPMTLIEAYQKIFIANKSKIKVADFGNTKITTADIKPTDKVIPIKGTVLTGGTSGASMVVDYIDASDGACNVYGYRTTIATFSSGEEVTGKVTTADDVTFDLSAAETAPPHWYDWTVYSADATNYGVMPSEATLACLYRGRLVLAGDSNNPHQWWMSKVGNPFKFLYDSTNDGDLSAISHANAKVGELGDIITALIAYKDDLVIFGCANSVWVLIGDPLSSGQLAKVTGKTGIWGSQSWCIDDRGNLCFLGIDGIYKMPISETVSMPENISKLTLPNLMSDLDLDKSLHRVTLTFDPVNYGIIISKTTLDDGVNSNYWFDLTTQGFFPETYPEECGIYSSYHYKSTDDTYTKVLFGCQDGYIREFKLTAKDDDIGATNETISSYVAFPIKMISEDENKEGKLLWLNGITAGGGTGGDFSDTDSVGWSLYVGNDTESILEKIKAETNWADATVYAVGDLVIYDSVEYRCIVAHTSDATGPPNEEPDTNTTDWLAAAFTTGTWSGTGKQTKTRVRARGTHIGLKLSNSTAEETWAINKIFGDAKQKGKSR